MNHCIRSFSRSHFSLLMASLFFSSALFAAEAEKNSSFLQKTAVQEWKFFDGNSIQSAINSAGPYCDFLLTNSSGLVWPKGSTKTAVYTAGIWVIGVHRPTGQLRTAVQDYQTEYQPGPILSIFNTATNDRSAAGNPDDQRYRVYKINRQDSIPGTNPDYDGWPGDLGAPYLDINGNGKWDKGIDKPKLWGDQQLWCVYNDADISRHTKAGTTPPLGIEVQATYFGYDQSGLLGNTMFIRWKIINKSDAAYDSVFIAMWSDTDLGSAGDDMCGVDTVRKLSYVYNYDENDEGFSGYGSRPPADGFVFFQGPKVRGASGDTALFEGNKITGWKNLPAYSHSVYFNANATYTDPPLGLTSFPQTAYRYMKGLIGISGLPYTDPLTNQPSRFAFPGDPVTESGWTQSKSGIPGTDVRSMISAGPFTLAKGDTQEIVGGFVIARGNNRLHSITVLRQTADYAQQSFNNNFNVPYVKVTASKGSGGAVLKILADGKKTDAASMQAELHDGVSALASISLYDDGTHGDEIPGDKKFTNSLTLPVQTKGIFLDLRIKDSKNNPTFWPRSAGNIATSILRISSPAVFADNLNQDGRVNPGETVRFGFSLVNQNSFALTDVTVSSPYGMDEKSISVAAVSPNTSVPMAYDPANGNSYFTLSVPPNYRDPEIKIIFTMTDLMNNEWIDSVVFPVVQYVQKLAVLRHSQGFAAGSPVVRVIDPASVKNHIYKITGVDSVDSNSNSGFTVQDSTDGRFLIRNAPFPDQLGFANPIVFDGWKLFPNDLTASLLSWPSFMYTDSLRWFSSPSTHAIITLGTISSTSVAYASVLKKGEYRNCDVRFSKRKSYTDLNGNGRCDIGEPYVVDSLNADGAQKAFFYQKPLIGKAKYTGFYWVPFALYDMSVAPARKLNVVVLDNELNNRWDAEAYGAFPTQKNYIWIMPDSYDPSGRAYDPSAGGIDFGQQALDQAAGFLGMMYISLRTETSDAYSSPQTLRWQTSYPLSAEDVYIFNPTVYSGTAENSIGVPEEFSLSQNYPNPFNPSTTIGYTLPVSSRVRVQIFNLLGQKISDLVNTDQPAGWYNAAWNANVSSGIYFYRIEAVSISDPHQRFADVKKMIVLR